MEGSSSHGPWRGTIGRVPSRVLSVLVVAAAAPFGLLSYREVRSHARQIAEVLRLESLPTETPVPAGPESRGDG